MSQIGRGPRSERGSEGEGRDLKESGGVFDGSICGLEGNLETGVVRQGAVGSILASFEAGDRWGESVERGGKDNLELGLRVWPTCQQYYLWLRGSG